MNPKDRGDGFINDQGEADFDIPTARGRERAQKKWEDAEDDGEVGRVSAGRSYSARRTLREREHEEEQQRRMFHGSKQEGLDDGDDYEHEYYDSGRTKAPPVVRIFAWIALLAIFFAGGYAGANYFFSKVDKPGALIGGVVGSGNEVRAGAGLSPQAGLSEVSYKLYMPLSSGDFEERAIKIRPGLTEDDIRHLLTVYVDGLKELTEFEPGVQVLNIYRSGDWLYVDMSQDFLKSLKTLGREKSTLVLTGLVRTMQDNFPPIKKIKFYINGKESRDKNPVNIENAWELKN